MKLIEGRVLFSMGPSPVLKRIRAWWLQRLEDHYLMCAAVERKKASDAHRNTAHFDKKAALTRSARGQ
jgi:hypothetical protein